MVRHNLMGSGWGRVPNVCQSGKGEVSKCERADGKNSLGQEKYYRFDLNSINTHLKKRNM